MPWVAAGLSLIGAVVVAFVIIGAVVMHEVRLRDRADEECR
jgi:hypothetical protein